MYFLQQKCNKNMLTKKMPSDNMSVQALERVNGKMNLTDSAPKKTVFGRARSCNLPRSHCLARPSFWIKK